MGRHIRLSKLSPWRKTKVGSSGRVPGRSVAARPAYVVRWWGMAISNRQFRNIVTL
jgi:hypothetical protein